MRAVTEMKEGNEVQIRSQLKEGQEHGNATAPRNARGDGK